MAKRKSRTLPPHVPVLPDRPAPLPSDLEGCKVSVVLDAQQRKMLLECQSMLYAREPVRYPSVTRVLKVAIATLYHNMTGESSPPAAE